MIKYNNFDLTEHNGYKLKSACSLAIFPETEQDVVDIYKNYSNIKINILGNGYNTILSKPYYDECFIIFNGNFNSLSIVDNQISAEAGIDMLDLSNKALEWELKGLEVFYDIPGSLGGAIVMNAGSNGFEIKDVLLKVRYLDLIDMTIKEINKDMIGFEYRDSFFQKNSNKVVLKAWIGLEKGIKFEILEKMKKIKESRLLKQPREFPNCGSVYKRPKGKYVGPMIDELGLKGYGIGGAKISDKHGGFIINTGNATGEDILSIISYTQKKVKDYFGIDLEVEQRII